LKFGPEATLVGLPEHLARMGSLTHDVYVWPEEYTMRTNIVIDDVLMRDALRATGLKTKREAVEMGLRTLLRLRKQEDVRKFRGRLHWEGNLDEMRNDQ
jgi:Arc/MetJ family transcription regulator